MGASESSRRIALSAVLTLLLGLSSCTVHSVREDVPPPVTLPDLFSSGAPAGGDGRTPDDAPLTDRWWEAFGDPALDEVVTAALDDNLDLRGAWARVDGARAAEAQARAGRMPNVSLGADAKHSRSVFFPGGPLGALDRTSTQFTASVAVAYEVDLWGRVGHLVSAAELDTQASREDLASLAMTLVSQVVETWYGLVEQRAQRALLRHQLSTNETFQSLVEARFGQGLASALDVLQQRRQVAATRAQLPLVEASVKILTHQLAVLTGRAPGPSEIGSPERLPELPPLPTKAVPSDLLRRRPDLRAAHMRVVAADHRLGAAIASRYPPLKLSGSLGVLSDFTEFVSSWLYSLAASSSLTAFDGGRLDAEAERARAGREELLARYGSTLLTAVREVEDALVHERHQRVYLEEIDAQLSIARQTLSEARSRYVNGLSDYLPVLTSLEALQQLERSALTARRQALSYRVQLCRALGGAWTDSLAHPDSLETRSVDGSADGDPSGDASGAEAPSPKSGDER